MTFQALRAERRRESEANPENLNMGIWDTKLPRKLPFVGFAMLYLDETDKRQAEIGCRIAPQYQSRGYASVALRAIIKYARQEREVEEFIGILEPRNSASKALVESLGFELYEKRPEALLYRLSEPETQS